MYLLRRAWSGRQLLVASICLGFVPWLVLLSSIQLFSQNRVALEFAFILSGIMALAFTALIALLLFILDHFIQVPGIALFLRRTLAVSLLVALPIIPLAPLFPFNLLLAVCLQTGILYNRLRGWQQEALEESVRLEPVFFLTVGMKVVIVACLLLLALA